MSKYFSDMIARSSEGAEIAKPRLASFFEPPRPEDATFRSLAVEIQKPEPLDSSFSTIGNQMTRRTDASPAPRSSVASEQSHELPTLFADHKPPLAASSTDSTETAQRRTSTPQGEFKGTEASRLLASADELVPTLPYGEKNIPKKLNNTETTWAVETGNMNQVHFNEREQATPARRLSAEFAAISDPRAPKTVSSQTRSNLESAPIHHRTVGGPVLAPSFLGAPLPTKVAPRKSGIQNSTLPHSTPPVEPTIHVTIGRVEIRANMEEKPKRSARTPSPVATLEDYLRKQRAGAER